MKYTSKVQEDPLTGDLFIEFPEEMMKNLDWTEDDDLVWSKNTDDTWSIRKKDDATLG